MNCKQGDLAIVVRACNVENIGRVARCMRVSIGGDVTGPGYRFPSAVCWVVEPPLSSWDGLGFAAAVPDAFMRPIRDNDGEDETLTLAGKPQCVPA